MIISKIAPIISISEMEEAEEKHDQETSKPAKR
jgi:hypothetical protein